MYKSIETLLVEIPTIRPHKMAVATMQTQTLVLVKISTEDGLSVGVKRQRLADWATVKKALKALRPILKLIFAPLLKSPLKLKTSHKLCVL